MIPKKINYTKHHILSFITSYTRINIMEAMLKVAETATLCEEMLQSINTSETGVHQKTLNRLVKFIDQFKQLNFANDSVMEAELEKVRSELLNRTAEEYRDSKYARTRLKQGLSQLAEQARELAKQDASELVQRFGELGKRKFLLAA